MSGSLRLSSNSLTPLRPREETSGEARGEKLGEAREDRQSKVTEAPEAPARVNMLLGQKRVTR